jgi:hypothetical protein
MTHTQKIGEHGSARLLNEDILLAALVALNMAKTGRTYLKMDSHPIRIPPIGPNQSCSVRGRAPLLGQGHGCLRIFHEPSLSSFSESPPAS